MSRVAIAQNSADSYQATRISRGPGPRRHWIPTNYAQNWIVYHFPWQCQIESDLGPTLHFKTKSSCSKGTSCGMVIQISGEIWWAILIWPPPSFRPEPTSWPKTRKRCCHSKIDQRMVKTPQVSPWLVQTKSNEALICIDGWWAFLSSLRAVRVKSFNNTDIDLPPKNSCFMHLYLADKGDQSMKTKGFHQCMVRIIFSLQGIAQNGTWMWEWPISWTSPSFGSRLLRPPTMADWLVMLPWLVFSNTVWWTNMTVENHYVQ